MCPLRVILIFLSATLAGFFVLKNLNKSQSHDTLVERDSPDPISDSSIQTNPPSKLRRAIKTGFWTCVDMASGRYLWRNLASSSFSSSKRSP